MMKTRIYYLILLSFLLLSSCEKEAIFTGKLPDPRLVLYSFIEPDSIIRVEVKTSRVIGEEYIKELQHVEGEIYINDEYKGQLHWYGGSTCTSELTARQGDRIYIKVRADGFKEASAETTIPRSGPEVIIDTLSSGKGNMEGTHLNIYVKISEPDVAHRYYRLIVQEKSINTMNFTYSDLHMVQDTFILNNYSFDKQGEPLLNDKKPDFPWNDEEDMDLNNYNIFSNSVFNGKSYTLNISTFYKKSYEGEIYRSPEGEILIGGIEYQYTVKLLQMDEPTYLYLKSEQSVYNSNSMDPVKVYSNVKNGMGVVGSFISYQRTFISPKEFRVFGEYTAL